MRRWCASDVLINTAGGGGWFFGVACVRVQLARAYDAQSRMARREFSNSMAHMVPEPSREPDVKSQTLPNHQPECGACTITTIRSRVCTCSTLCANPKRLDEDVRRCVAVCVSMCVCSVFECVYVLVPKNVIPICLSPSHHSLPTRVHCVRVSACCVQSDISVHPMGKNETEQDRDC